MKKLLFLLFPLISYCQNEGFSLDLGMGYSANNSILYDMSLNRLYKNFGVYFGGRGFNITSSPHDTNVDYSSIDNQTILLSQQNNYLGSWGMCFGLNYSIPKTKFKVLTGIGFAKKMTEHISRYRYDFLYTTDEYNTKYNYSEINTMSYEILLNYNTSKTTKPYGFIIQTGYNNVNKFMMSLGVRMNLNNM